MYALVDHASPMAEITVDFTSLHHEQGKKKRGQ